MVRVSRRSSPSYNGAADARAQGALVLTEACESLLAGASYTPACYRVQVPWSGACCLSSSVR